MIYYIILYMQITEEQVSYTWERVTSLSEWEPEPDEQPHKDLTASSLQIKVWTANPQQFVEDEDDDTFSYTVRIAAQDLLLVRIFTLFWI